MKTITIDNGAITIFLDHIAAIEWESKEPGEEECTIISSSGYRYTLTGEDARTLGIWIRADAKLGNR